MKKIIGIITLVILVCLAICGCSSGVKENKSVLSLYEFTSVMTNDGSVMDKGEQVGDATLEQLISYGMAINDEKHYTVIYYQAKNVDFAKTLFGWMENSLGEQVNDMIADGQSTGNEESFEPILMTKDYQEVYYAVGNYYVRLIRVENLVVEVSSTAGSVNEVKRIFNLLGY